MRQEQRPQADSSPEAPATIGSRKRFGAFGGVFTPSILTILGVVMYLRLGWVVGNAGLAGALLIIVLSHVISLITGLSVSSIATNRTVGAGGAYFMISRSTSSLLSPVSFNVCGFGGSNSGAFDEPCDGSTKTVSRSSVFCSDG